MTLIPPCDCGWDILVTVLAWIKLFIPAVFISAVAWWFVSLWLARH